MQLTCYIPRYTVELRLFGSWISGSTIIWIGLTLRVNLSRFLQKVTCLEIACYLINYNTVLWLT